MTEECQKDAVPVPKHGSGKRPGSRARPGVSLLGITLLPPRRRAGRQLRGGAGHVKPDRQP